MMPRFVSNYVLSHYLLCERVHVYSCMMSELQRRVILLVKIWSRWSSCLMLCWKWITFDVSKYFCVVGMCFCVCVCEFHCAKCDWLSDFDPYIYIYVWIWSDIEIMFTRINQFIGNNHVSLCHRFHLCVCDDVLLDMCTLTCLSMKKCGQKN